MSIVWQWYGLGLTDPTTITTSTVGTGDNAFSTVSGAPVFTGGAMHFAADSTARSVSKSGLGQAAHAWRGWLKVGSTFAAVPLVKHFATGGLQIRGVSMNSSGQLVQRNAADSGIATTAALTPGVRYRIDITYNSVTGNSTLTVTNPDGSVFYSASIATGSTSAVDTVKWGRDASTVAGPIDFDSVKIANTNTAIGPDNTAPVVTTTAVQTAAAGASVSLTASVTDDGSITAYAWVITRYRTDAAPATITPTSGATAATCTWVAGPAGSLDVATVTVTDDGSPALTGTAKGEVRVPVAAVAGAVNLRPLAGYPPVTTGTWTLVGSAASDGAALADELATTLVQATTSSTAVAHRHRLQPAPAGVLTIAATVSAKTDTGAASATGTIWEGATQRGTGTATAIGLTAVDITATADGTTVVDPGNIWLQVSGVAA